RGRDSAQADAKARHSAAFTQGQREAVSDRGNVVEHALADLVKALKSRQRARNAHGANQFARGQRGAAIAEEELAERQTARSPLADELELGSQREQRGRRITDRRRGPEVAAESRAIANQP